MLDKGFTKNYTTTIIVYLPPMGSFKPIASGKLHDQYLKGNIFKAKICRRLICVLIMYYKSVNRRAYFSKYKW